MLLAELAADQPCPMCFAAPCPCPGQLPVTPQGTGTHADPYTGGFSPVDDWPSAPKKPTIPIPVAVGSPEYMKMGLPIAPGTEPYWIAAGAVALFAMIVILRR